MNLFTLALRNIKRHFHKYVMYVFSLSFSVFTAYSFLALLFNEQIKHAFTHDNRYQSFLISFGVIIIVFIFFFLISSNNSFIKARKKEISTYSLFGMPNHKIGLLLFIETMIIGSLTLLIGIGLGVFFSKLTAMLLLNMSLSSYTDDIGFTITIESILITTSLFLIIFSIMGLAGLRVIHKFQLVDLFKADKVAETKTKGSYFGLVLSIALITTGYVLAFSSDPQKVFQYSLVILLLVITGTYLFFWSGLAKVLHLLKKIKKMYYKGDALISISALSHRTLTISSLMATIAVLSAVATTAIATGYTLYSNIEQNTYNTVGYDLHFYNDNPDLVSKVHTIFENHEIDVIDQYSMPLQTVEPNMSDIYGSYTKHHYINSNQHYFRIYNETTFHEFLSLSKRKDVDIVSLKNGEALYVRSFVSEELEEAIIGEELFFSEEILTITSALSLDIGLFGALDMLVIGDDDYDHLMAVGDIHTTDGYAYMINYEQALSSTDLNAELNELLQNNDVWGYRLALNHYIEAMETFGLILFIGLFLSVMIILMTASLIYFKQVTAAEEEKHQFLILRKIGMSKQIERKVISNRLLPIFFIPLVLGILHSVFAMKTADTVVFLYMIEMENSYLIVLLSSAIMYAVYTIIYCIFYFITKRQYAELYN
ncbi:ABC transporter permease [Bacillus sp. JCM 19034]|uniref:ABC transporter permease n=1 Tax=Bacillus sp. JCM 19034 TaxID=1481928 RepID=UPI0007866FAD|nr:ABC transporter permease [Bacillus sp. JCM 19034]